MDTDRGLTQRHDGTLRTRARSSNGLNCPEFVELSNGTHGFQVRQYAAAYWARTVVEDISLDSAQRTGFFRLFDYISGASQRERSQRQWGGGGGGLE